jgi:hypothetical protein
VPLRHGQCARTVGGKGRAVAQNAAAKDESLDVDGDARRPGHGSLELLDGGARVDRHVERRAARQADLECKTRCFGAAVGHSTHQLTKCRPRDDNGAFIPLPPLSPFPPMYTHTPGTATLSHEYGQAQRIRWFEKKGRVMTSSLLTATHRSALQKRESEQGSV